jgi:hypothetical protein
MSIQIKASKNKEMQVKRLSFPWIPLVEFGLFKGLQRIQIKKSLPSFRPDRNVSYAYLLRPPDNTPRLGFGEEGNNSTGSDFRK